MTKEIRARFFGEVQGVGFRYRASALARSLGIVGTVKNEPDGSVSLVAQGPEDLLKDFIKRLTEEIGTVSRVKTDWRKPEQTFFSFDITRG